uniref:DUF569 domain-containing protein n=1 Tax=Aegilops tauschii subsp. strangulata TaxID=200361 RepID=A0A453QRD8_AEGTS
GGHPRQGDHASPSTSVSASQPRVAAADDHVRVAGHPRGPHHPRHVRVRWEVRVPPEEQLARRLGDLAIMDLEVADLVMCLPTHDGQLIPLVVDLPRSGETLHIVVVIVGSPAYMALQYLDVDA